MLKICIHNKYVAQLLTIHSSLLMPSTRIIKSRHLTTQDSNTFHFKVLYFVSVKLAQLNCALR